ncbi:MFS transporter [Actinomadura violacea]|uniref:MFS transporter n=1 Tax=Actinomadura violacea TaxID=2819934 RepID=A0ABS3S039_9ACTN|nr:MFS transporter [Actinomadura violacea]MBO2462359.1 MFS transporter [Actinomadura violacea]
MIRRERNGYAADRRGEPHSRARLVAILVVLVLITETAPLELALVYPAIRSMSATFGPDHIDKAVTLVNLAAVVSIPLIGRLADVVGKKRVLVGCSVAFAAGSLVCATAPSLPVLLLGRMLQGVVGGVLSVAYSLVRDVFPARSVPLALGFVSTGVGVSGIAAPFLGGALVDGFGFRGVFWFLLALVVLLLPALIVIVPESPMRRPRRLDAAGALLLGAAAACLLAGIGVGARSGWLAGGTLGSFAAAGVMFAAFTWRERRTASPAVDLSLLASPALRATLLCSACGMAVLGAIGYLVPQMLQTPHGAATAYGQGLTALAAAGWVFPQGLAAMVFGPVGGLLARRHGPRLVLIPGLAAYGLAATALSALPGHRWQFLLVAACVGIGQGLYFAAVSNLVLDAVPAAHSGTGTGLLAVCGQLGAALSVTVLGAVLAAHRLPATVHQSGTVPGIGGAAGRNGAASYTGDGVSIAFLFAAGLSVAGLAVALTMSHGRSAARGGAAARGTIAGR